MAACGGDDPVKGSGYSYALPDEWVDRTDEAEDEPAFEIAGLRPDTVATADRFEGFYTNVNVIREAGLPDGFTVGRYADISIAALRDPASSGFPPEVIDAIEQQHVQDLSDLGSTELAGERAASWEYASTRDGRALRVRQLVAVRSNVAYSLTYTAAKGRFEEDLPGFEEIVESWRWE
jgi:hypothetical protein